MVFCYTVKLCNAHHSLGDCLSVELCSADRFETYLADFHRIDRVIFAEFYAFSCDNARAALTHNDAANGCFLSVVNLRAEILRLRVTHVLCRSS